MEVSPKTFFKDNTCDGAFITTEYAYDAKILRDYFLAEIAKLSNVRILYDTRISSIDNNGKHYVFKLADGEVHKSDFVVNATYASVNQIHEMLGFSALNIKYELCELILVKPVEKLKNVGITVMDGPFFSIMPFGKTDLHSLTSVTFTPHIASYESVPTFSCQEESNGFCTTDRLGNCNFCPVKPKSARPYMESMARKYLRDEYGFEYMNSLYSMKPILKASEIDDSRPTAIRKYTDHPRFISVLSGKINTVYELDKELIS